MTDEQKARRAERARGYMAHEEDALAKTELSCAGNDRLWLGFLDRRMHELDCRMAEVTNALAIALDRMQGGGSPQCGAADCVHIATWTDPSGVGWCPDHLDSGIYTFPQEVR